MLWQPKVTTGTGPGMGTDSLDADALYRAYVRPLYLFIYGKVGNREAAEDLTSEVFVKALTHLDSSREERSIVAWLYRVARNAVADYWRAGGRRAGDRAG